MIRTVFSNPFVFRNACAKIKKPAYCPISKRKNGNEIWNFHCQEPVYADSLETAPGDLAMNKSDLVGAQELRFDNHGIEH